MNGTKNNNRILSYGTYIALWIALNVLTAFSIALGGMDFGDFNVFFMLSISTAMSYAVLIYFMNVKFESLFFKLFMIVTTVILVAVFSIVLFGYNL
ncbi:MAG: hypothetical protein GXO87_03630 [Chlorobi bacterium]|nr:hypothetical protein [Chlorobiota bacterium]